MHGKRAVGASEGSAGEAAREVLTYGNAVDAVVAGVLVAAAETPSVFLGPVQLLLGGHGAGLRAVDGRVRQPGRGMSRPRGVPAGESVPAPAWVGVPALPGALALAVASLGSVGLSKLSRAAVAYAKEFSAERSAVLAAFAGQAAAAMVDDAIAGELTAVAGRSVGGALTREDLAAVRPVATACDERSLSEDAVLRVPWKQKPCDGSNTQVIAAADAGGLVALACYESGMDGLAIASLGLVAPPFAAPVRRREVRVRPGEARPAAAPIALRAPHGLPDLALGLAATVHAEVMLDEILAALRDSPSQVVRALSATSGELERCRKALPSSMGELEGGRKAPPSSMEGRSVAVVCASNAAALAGRDRDG